MDALDRLGLVDYRVTIGHVGILGELLSKLGLTGRVRTQLLESLEETRRARPGCHQGTTPHELDPDLFDPLGDDPVERTLPAQSDGVGEEHVRASLTGLLSKMGAERPGRARSEGDIVERLLRKLRPQSHREAVERALESAERLGGIRGEPREVLGAGRDLLQAFGLAAAPGESGSNGASPRGVWRQLPSCAARPRP